LLTAIYVD